MTHAHISASDSASVPTRSVPKPGAHLKAVKTTEPIVEFNGSPLIVNIMEELPPGDTLKALMRIMELPWLVTLRDITLLTHNDVLAIQDIDKTKLYALIGLLHRYHLDFAKVRDPMNWINIGSLPVPLAFIPGMGLDRLVPELNRFLRRSPHMIGDIMLLRVNNSDILDLSAVGIKTIEDLYNKSVQHDIIERFPRKLTRMYWVEITLPIVDRLLAIVRAYLNLMKTTGLPEYS